MSRIKTYWKYIAILFVFVAIFVYSTSLVIFIFKAMNIPIPEKTVQPKRTVQNEQNAQLMHFDINQIGPGDLFSGAAMSVEGWAFVENDTPYAEKEVRLFLVSYENDVYEIGPAILLERPDVKAAFSSLPMNENSLDGFRYPNIPLIGLKNGKYEIYVYCKETDDLWGYMATGRIIEKTDRLITEYNPREAISPPCEADLYSNDSIKMSYFTEDVSISDDIITVSGWAFLENADSSKQKVYIVFTNDAEIQYIFEAGKISRNDVGKAFDTDLYNESGFIANIRISDLPDDVYSISIACFENNEKQNVSMLSGGIKINNAHAERLDTAPEQTEYALKTETIALDSEKTNLVDMSYSLDRLEVREKGVYVQGWAFIPERNASDTDVYIEVFNEEASTSYTYSTTKRDREDVVEAFNSDKRYLQSGFEAFIPLSHFSDGNYGFKLYSSFADDTVALAMIDKNMTVNKNETTILDGGS
jgi:hypothetical protein